MSKRSREDPLPRQAAVPARAAQRASEEAERDARRTLLRGMSYAEARAALSPDGAEVAADDDVLIDAELAATGEMDWGEIRQGSFDDLRSGIVSGGMGVLSAAPRDGLLAGLAPDQLALLTGSTLRHLAADAARSGARADAIEALQAMCEEAFDLARDPAFFARWARDPHGAFREFQGQILASGASGFAGNRADETLRQGTFRPAPFIAWEGGPRKKRKKGEDEPEDEVEEVEEDGQAGHVAAPEHE